MIELIRGNKDSLEGRASAHAHNRQLHEHSGGAEYPALYIASNVSDAHLSCDPPEFEDEPKKTPEEMMKKFMKNGAPNPKDLHYTPLIIRGLPPIENPEELEEFPGDIFFAGNLPCLAMAQELLHSGAIIYFARFQNQLYERMRPENNRVRPTAPVESFRQFDEPSLTKRLYGLAGDLFSARSRNDKVAEDYVCAQFTRLVEGAPFAVNVANIIDAARKPDAHTNLYIELQVKLASCIHGERYQEAAAIKKQLESLTQK